MADLIIQLQDQTGTFHCETYEGFPSMTSYYIAICHTNDPASAQQASELKDKFRKAVTRVAPAFKRAIDSCGRTTNLMRCMAFDPPPIFQKLLIVVTSGQSNSFVSNDIVNWPPLKYISILNRATTFALPSNFSSNQATRWSIDISEVIPTIFGIVGIGDEDLRIFISYRRVDATPLAEQLHDQLTHKGFEVFLDSFSIHPGVHFQMRLFQELADKAMVVFLESEHFLDSKWIKLEIAFAKKYRLGYLALNIDNSKKIAYIDDEFREQVQPVNGVLPVNDLDKVITRIEEEHAVALYRKRELLTNSVMQTLTNAGYSPVTDANGFISVVDTSGQTHTISALVRPPVVDSYHKIETSGLGPHHIVGPIFKERQRGTVNAWLSDKTNVKFHPEGRLNRLVKVFK